MGRSGIITKKDTGKDIVPGGYCSFENENIATDR